MLYGASGYTGRLVAKEAVRQGIAPILGGRSLHSLTSVAADYNLTWRLFDQQQACPSVLDGVSLVVNCAGPFAETAPWLARLCVECGVHYIDIGGEVSVVQQLLQLDASARSHGVAIVPACGLASIATDCLAQALLKKLPTPTHLRFAVEYCHLPCRGSVESVLLALLGWRKGLSVAAGSLRTAVLSLGCLPLSRRERKIEVSPWGSKTIQVGFDGQIRHATLFPWPDAFCLYPSTQVANIESYLVLKPWEIRVLKMVPYMSPFLQLPLIQRSMLARLPANYVPKFPIGGQNRIWAKAISGDHEAQGWLTHKPGQHMSGYDFTVFGVLAVAKRMLANRDHPVGFCSPAQVAGDDLWHDIVNTELWVDSQ
nr:saccharopine dehydrogenase NADP-binding domain-containing protein [Desulfurispira natronophila]